MKKEETLKVDHITESDVKLSQDEMSELSPDESPVKPEVLDIEALKRQFPGQFRTKHKPISLSKKIGRNEKCPCGSAKKFKNCCIDKITSERDEVLNTHFKEHNIKK